MNKKYQVFISSTFLDLQEERQACVEAILKAGHIPAGMELFAAGNESQLTIVKQWIEKSDIYVLIIGGRYGSLEPKSGLSYTEIEYRYATELNKPFFAIVLSDKFIDEKVKIKGKDVLELTHGQKLTDFRDLALSKISKICHNKDQIESTVLHSLREIESKYDLDGWVKADKSIQNSDLINNINFEEEAYGDSYHNVLNDVKLKSSKDLKIGFKELNSRMDKLFKTLAYVTGWYNSVSIVTSDSIIKFLIDNEIIAGNNKSSYNEFLKVKEKITSNREQLKDSEVLFAIEVGLHIIKGIFSMPMEVKIIKETNLPLYLDSNCTQEIKNGSGILYETISPSQFKRDFHIHPTTRTDYKKGQRVTWEFDSKTVFNQCFYIDPLTNEKKSAFFSSMGFIGRDIETLL